MLNICSVSVGLYCKVSEGSCGPSPYVYAIISLIISLFSADHSFKETGLENLEQSIYLYILWFLNFDYGIHLSIIHVSKYCLMPVSFYPWVVILKGWG